MDNKFHPNDATFYRILANKGSVRPPAWFLLLVFIAGFGLTYVILSLLDWLL